MKGLTAKCKNCGKVSKKTLFDNCRMADLVIDLISEGWNKDSDGKWLCEDCYSIEVNKEFAKW